MKKSVEVRSFRKSEAFLQRARNVIPGGVTSNVRLGDLPSPLFYARGEGCRLWDVDGNEYIDHVLARGPLILGHNPRAVLERVRKAIELLQLCAAQTELEIEVAEKIRACVPTAEMVRFSLSGSEAVHATIRLARAYTGRNKIIKFEGHYHGWLDNVLVSVSSVADQAHPHTRAVLQSAGQDPKSTEDIIVLAWNDLAMVEDAFRTHSGKIAAVITEPIMFNSASIFPYPGYLEGLRRLCDQHGSLLIFDEVITGFRVGLAGAQGLFGIFPDLSVFGKAVAGGFPLSVIAGKRDIMERFAAGEVNHSGTFNGHVASLAAAAATLDELQRDNGAVFSKIEATGKFLMQEISRLFMRLSIPSLVQGLPCMFFIGFTADRSIGNHRAAMNCDYELCGRLVSALMHRGVRIFPRGTVAVSAAHTLSDAGEVLSRVEDAAREIKR